MYIGNNSPEMVKMALTEAHNLQQEVLAQLSHNNPEARRSQVPWLLLFLSWLLPPCRKLFESSSKNFSLTKCCCLQRGVAAGLCFKLAEYYNQYKQPVSYNWLPFCAMYRDFLTVILQDQASQFYNDALKHDENHELARLVVHCPCFLGIFWYGYLRLNVVVSHLKWFVAFASPGAGEKAPAK